SRAALLASNHAINLQSRSQREELLSPHSGEKIKLLRRESYIEDALMKANHDVTDALQRTIGLMQKELERSAFSSHHHFSPHTYRLLHTESCTATLQPASTMHDTLDLIIGTSKELFTTLEMTDWLDRILIISGLVFFSLVVLFILKQRIIDRGLRIAFFWTRLLPSSGSSTRAVVQKAVEVVTTASATTTTVSAVLASSQASVHKYSDTYLLD
ncbi:hypothetical protein BDR05DRAFT_1011608, partial [Suillus weaverae]